MAAIARCAEWRIPLDVTQTLPLSLPRTESPLVGTDSDTSASAVRWGTLWLIWSVPAVIGALQQFANLIARNEFASNWPFALLQFGVWWSWIPLTRPVLRLTRRWPVAPAEGSAIAWRAIALHSLVALVITAVHAVLWFFVSLQLQLWIEPSVMRGLSYGVMVSTAIASRLIVGLMTYGAVVAVGTTANSFARLRDQQLRATRLAAQLTQAELGALKMQLQPHFLFNTLHAISVLTRVDPAAAATMVTRLGDLLRLTLSRAGSAEVTLDRELEFVRLYLEIESTRFADRLRVRYEIDPNALNARVPDLLLQPLVENAIRHGIGPRSSAGQLTIRATRRVIGDAERLLLEVEDDGVGVSESAVDGIGLSATRARLVAMFGADNASLQLERAEHGGCRAVVELPWRTFATDDQHV